MKKMLLLFLTFISLCSVAQENEGIQMIEDKTFEEILAIAKAQNKLVFMDCYTTWCGPCKFLSNSIFPLKESGDYFNEKFICTSFDMEKGEGKTLATKYEVMAYPTLLFFNHEGEIVHKQIGAPQSAEALIAVGEKALSADNKYLSMSRKLKNKSNELTYDEIDLLLDLMETKDAQYWSKQYLQKVPDSLKFSEHTLRILGNQTNYYTDASFRYILQNEEAFKEKISNPKMVDELITNIYARAFMSHQQLLNQKHDLLDEGQALASYWTTSRNYSMNSTDTACWKAYVNAFDNLFQQNIPTNMEINNVAWKVYENYKKFNDIEALKTAKTWCDKAITEERNMYITDTYASILFDLGETKKAIEIQEEAVKLIQASNDQGYIDAYQKRLEEFKKAL